MRVIDQWTQTLVKQPDGVVIFEAHISAQYLHEVIGEAHKRWPSSPIKALVMTSDRGHTSADCEKRWRWEFRFT